jgi:hypothetical protein
MLNKRAFFLVIIIFLSAPLLFSQNTGVSLSVEIQNMERSASGQGVSPAQKHEALVRLARLRQLSGDIEGAARAWLDAAGAIPGQVDDDALLACAYCLAAMGEWDRARTAIEPLLMKSARARLLNVSINAVSTGNNSTLAAIADNSEYSQMKSEIFFLLWKISTGQTAENWRLRLVREFPDSPEGRIAVENAPAVSVNPSPFWLFLKMESQGAVTARPAPQAQTAPASVSAPAVTPASQTRLQTGVFGRQANAQAQADRLKQAGFSPSIDQRGEMWAVTVPAGADENRSIRELREAGFESFPLR